ncbi:hypothetical protein FACS1894182_15110 [Bacteroidia bacterium]|nr:hypothetical protein FACS1894182_15110 [Bacteroidia bacterium]
MFPVQEVRIEKSHSKANRYVIHYEKGQTPPANAFWSLTSYDPNGLLAANPLNRYAIGDRSNLKMNVDGSVDIYIQRVSPGKNREFKQKE